MQLNYCCAVFGAIDIKYLNVYCIWRHLCNCLYMKFKNPTEIVLSTVSATVTADPRSRFYENV